MNLAAGVTPMQDRASKDGHIALARGNTEQVSESDETMHNSGQT